MRLCDDTIWEDLPTDQKRADLNAYRFRKKYSTFKVGDTSLLGLREEEDKPLIHRLQVVHRGSIASMLEKVHYNNGHISGRKMFQFVLKKYHGIPRYLTQKFVDMCPVCQVRVPKRKKNKPGAL